MASYYTICAAYLFSAIKIVIRRGRNYYGFKIKININTFANLNVPVF